jgi:hypothetical protein
MLSDPRQVTLLLLGPFFTPYGGVGVVAGQLTPHITPCRRGSGGRGGGGITAGKYVQTQRLAGVY